MSMTSWYRICQRDTTAIILHWCLFMAFFPPSLAFSVRIHSNANLHKDNVLGCKMSSLKQTSQNSSYSPEAPSIDWNMYNLKHQYQKSGGILYKQSILSPKEYTIIMSELSRLDLPVEDEKESSFATKRVGCTIGSNTEIYRILSCPQGSLSALMNGLECDEDERIMIAPDVPVEVRSALHLFYFL